MPGRIASGKGNPRFQNDTMPKIVFYEICLRVLPGGGVRRIRQFAGAMKLRQNRKKIKMKTRSLLTLGAAAFAAITLNVAAADALLSPRAAGNQIQRAAGTANDVKLVSTTGITASPRALANQTKTVADASEEVNPAIICAKTMTASPKAIQACVQSGTMSGCKPMTVASVK